MRHRTAVHYCTLARAHGKTLARPPSPTGRVPRPLTAPPARPPRRSRSNRRRRPDARRPSIDDEPGYQSASVATSDGPKLPTYTDYWHCGHSMRSRVYETVRCPPVCPSVCPGIGPHQQTRRCRFSAVGPAGSRYLSIAAAAACGGRMGAVGR